jgi:hypothetical protein
MATEANDDEPKLTVKLRSEIMPPEPFEYSVIKPEPVVKPEDEEESDTEMEPEQTTIEPEEDEERFEETMEVKATPKVLERKPQREKVKRSKELKSITRLYSELKRHSDARKKTDSAILDIKKGLKDLLLAHHATIKDLQKQVSQMHRKISAIEKSRKSTRLKTTGKKIIRVGKTSSSNKKNKSGQKKSTKR